MKSFFRIWDLFRISSFGFRISLPDRRCPAKKLWPMFRSDGERVGMSGKGNCIAPAKPRPRAGWKNSLALWAGALVIVQVLLRNAPALEAVPEKLVALTFDDSFASHYSVVRPILKRYGFGATFFI